MATGRLPLLARLKRSRVFHVIADLRNGEYTFYCGMRVQPPMIQENKPLGSPDVNRCDECVKSQISRHYRR